MISKAIIDEKLKNQAGVDEDLLKLVTIILPTINRPLLIKRAIAYYKNWACKFIICDSSSQRFDETFEENINYLYCPGESLPMKLSESIKRVQTPYVCICADDDFLSQTGILNGINFLETNEDYVSVQGEYTQFHWMDNEIRCYPLYHDLQIKDITSDSHVLRVKDSAKSGMHQIYSLHRTNVLNASLNLYKEFSYTPGIEYCTSLVGMFFGKHKFLPCFWMARDSGQYTAHYKKEKNSLISTNLHGFLSSTEGNRFKEKFAKLFNLITHESYSEGIKLFDEVFSLLTNKIKTKEVKKYRSNYSTLIKSYLPNWIRDLKSRQYDDPFFWVGNYFYKNSPFKNKVSKQELDLIKQIVKQHGNIPTIS